MRRTLKVLAIAATAAGLYKAEPAKAAYYGLPRALAPQVHRIHFAEPTLAPIAHTRFCMQYPKDCAVRRMIFRGGAMALNKARWGELVKVNAEINRSIRPERNTAGVAGERWLIAPKSGDCNDYAVTKRHELLNRGWSSRNLLLAEVVTSWGEHHLVLVVRTRGGDFVADSLSSGLRPWSQTRYQWVRIQSPSNPAFWSTVGRTA